MKQKTDLIEEVLLIHQSHNRSTDDGLSLALNPFCTPLTVKEHLKEGLSH